MTEFYFIIDLIKIERISKVTVLGKSITNCQIYVGTDKNAIIKFGNSLDNDFATVTHVYPMHARFVKLKDTFSSSSNQIQCSVLVE